MQKSNNKQDNQAKKLQQDEPFRKIRNIDTQLYQQHRDIYNVAVNRVLASRPHEIEELQKSLVQQESSKHKRTFQRLPRHLRRRQMSANPHLVPRNLRKAAINEIHLPQRVQQRRRRKIKKRHNDRNTQWQQFQPQSSIQSPVDDINYTGEKQDKRLCTHMFHAKRMHMESKWGMRLPLTSTQKSFRISHRFTRQHATIHDVSYHLCVQAEGKTDVLFEFIRVLSGTNDELSDSITDGSAEGHFLLYDNQSCLGPVQYVFRVYNEYDNDESDENDSFCAVQLWIHVASLPDSYSHIQRIATQLGGIDLIYRNDLARFEIRGAHSTTLLHKLFKLNSNCTKEASEAWNTICTKVTRPDSLPRNMIICLETHHPLANSIQKLNSFPKTAATTTNKEDVMNDESDDEIINEDMNELMVSIPEGIAHNETIWTKLTLPQSVTSQKKSQINEENYNDQSAAVMLIQKDGCSDYSVRNHGYGSGWDMICSTQHAVHLWSKMANMKNVLPLSLHDRKILRLDQGKLSFPDDFPDSPAFHREHPEETFLSSNAGKWKAISLLLPWGGNPQQFDSIHQCDTEEYNRIQKDKSALKKQENKAIIGALTSTTYSLLRSHGYAVGYILKDEIQVVEHMFKNIVLVGGNDHGYLRPCVIKTISL
jgi:hypothetical protein